MGHWRNQRENQKLVETNENGNTTTQNLWDTAKTVLRGEFIAIKACLRKQEKINKLTLNLKELEKEQTKSKVSRRKEIIKIRAEIHEIDTKNNRKDQWRAGSLDWKPLTKLIKKKRERWSVQINQKWKRSYNGNQKYKKSTVDHNEQLYVDKVDSLKGMDKFQKCTISQDLIRKK